MASTFTDQHQPAHDPTQPKPRGLLPVPAAVAEHVEKEGTRAQREYGFALTPEARQRMLNEGALDWFYRDQWVSYRVTPQGVEVLAVGLEQTAELGSQLTEAERSTIKTKLV
jgi:hypothetical protein